jgi:REP element-mobilizing transposase RayT
MIEDQWQWQEPGTAWKGVGTYHITLTVPSRQPLLGTLVVPDNDPLQARVERTALGNAIVDELYVMCRHYPAIRIYQFCLMPDHLHAVIRVTRVMDTSIRNVIRGYWQGVKKLGRAYTLSLSSGSSAFSSGSSAVSSEFNSGITAQGSPASPANQNAAQGSPTAEGSNGWAFPVFTERPFIRPLSRRGQLKTMMHYVQMNPQRLATKRLMPGFFRVQKGIEIIGRSFDGVGNMALLQSGQYDVVHVRSVWVKAAEHGDSQALRDYMNSRVLGARKGVVMVSPFISPQEKQVMHVLINEEHPFILLADNGFRDYYKPSDALFDACAAGRVLILSPWPYDADKRHISRADCVSLNNMAEEFCRIIGKDG